jgi:EAL domain-containing protein (putative c-di-GMP-specific phosphodiesterase class I)/CheY-like chemotaxis protein
MPAAPPTSVLVVDDEPFMLGLLHRALSRLGVAEVITRDSAHAALQELEASQVLPELILLDLNMPGMDGVEFIRRLANVNYTGALILVSGEDQHVLGSIDKLVHAHGIHSLGHLSKPVELKALAARLDNWANAREDGLPVARKACRPEELREAIASGALVNYYQPVVAVASGDLVGAEALIRWPLPNGSVLAPEQFIAVAERHGLIGELTTAMLSAAFWQTKAWRDTGLTLRLSVEVPISCLIRLSFPDAVMNQAAAAGVSPDMIAFEVRESQLIANLANELDVFSRLRLKRFHLTIDEFGAGHSSLAQLRDIPFDGIKVHHSFVHSAAADAKLRAIYGASLAVGKALRMKVIAEGVEDRADWDLLRRSGCDLAQGPLIAQPMPGEALAAWAAAWRTRLLTRISSAT